MQREMGGQIRRPLEVLRYIPANGAQLSVLSDDDWGLNTTRGAIRSSRKRRSQS